MSSSNQSRQQRRKTERAHAKGVGHLWSVTARKDYASDAMERADAAFYRRFPARTTRMRLASRAEVERAEARRIADHILPGPAGSRWFALVMYDGQGGYSRQFLMAAADTDTDLSEAEALAKWNAGNWPPGHLSAGQAIVHAAGYGGSCVRLYVPAGAGAKAYADAAAALHALHGFAAQSGMPEPMVAKVEGGVCGLWALYAPVPGIPYAAVFARLAALQGA